MIGRGVLCLIGGCSVLSAVAALRVSAAPHTEIKVYKDPSCECCAAWVKHIQDNGFATSVEIRTDLADLKRSLGVPNALTSWHTASVGDYVLEGHVPAREIFRLINPETDSARPCCSWYAYRCAGNGIAWATGRSIQSPVYSENRPIDRGGAPKASVVLPSNFPPPSTVAAQADRYAAAPSSWKWTSPQSSSTSRCCVNDGKAMSNGRANSLTGAEPPLSRLRTARRVGSPRA